MSQFVFMIFWLLFWLCFWIYKLSKIVEAATRTTNLTIEIMNQNPTEPC